jgi:hypothetical protein
MTEELNHAIERNTSHKCKASGCNRFRTLLSGYCKSHFKRVNLYGNPEGKVLRKAQYIKEYEDVSELILDNLEHLSTTTALSFIQKWIDDAKEGSPCVTPKELSRLSSKAVTALDILIEAASIYLYSQRNPHLLPDDKELSYQMGIGVLRLCPQTYSINVSGFKVWKKASGGERRDVGQYLRDNLGLYFYNVRNTINRQLELDKEFRENLFTPLAMAKHYVTVDGRKVAVKTPLEVSNY